jgi:nitrogen fixation protein FixH
VTELDMPVVDEAADAAFAPWHLWVVGVLALMFTAFGAYDYVMSQLADRAYIGAMVEPFGIETDVGVAYFSSFPLWADAVWAIGVWGAVAGSLLLLARRAWAYPAYLVSLAGLVASNLYTAANPVPGLTDSSMSYATVAIIAALMVALTLYARSQRDRGVLR